MDDFDLATEERLDALADRLWTKIVGVQFNPIELHLRAKLALEHHLLGSTTPSFGLDKMSAAETAAYVGVQVETLRDRSKRRVLGIPEPYPIARKLFWRRSEIDPWIEARRSSAPETTRAVSAKFARALPPATRPARSGGGQ